MTKIIIGSVAVLSFCLFVHYAAQYRPDNELLECERASGVLIQFRGKRVCFDKNAVITPNKTEKKND